LSIAPEDNRPSQTITCYMESVLTATQHRWTCAALMPDKRARTQLDLHT